MKEFRDLRAEIAAERYVLEIWKRVERDAVNRLSLLVLLVALFGLTSCHHTAAASTAVTCTSTSATSSSSSSITCTDPVTSISLTVSPATISINVTNPQQFNGSLAGGTNNKILWTVNKMAGGSPDVGVIDTNGLYHAPRTVPSPNPVSVTATSYEDQNLSATASVTILPAPVLTITSPSPPVKVTSGAAAANQVTFIATETGGQSTDVIYWCAGPVNGNAIFGGNSTFGTIDANGVYTPPLTPPFGSAALVTAAITQDCLSSATSEPITISGYSTSSLQGQFAFSVAGKNGAVSFVRAGSFIADGSGGLNSGTEDINDSSGAPARTIFFTGTYTVAADGRGTLKFNDGATATNYNFVLVNATQLRIIGFDSTGTATGQANAQDITTFHDSALTGTYVFDFAGAHGSNGISEIGEFTADGTGHITGGSIDINDGGTSAPFQIAGSTAIPGNPCAAFTASTYSIGSNGRGTAVLATNDPSFCTLTLAFYVVSRGSAKFAGTDSTQTVSGVSLQQAPNAMFDQTSLSGNYAFLLSGSGSGGTYASAGSFSADGNLHVTTGSLDENISGTPSSNVMLSGVNYTVASSGRGTLTFTGNRTFVFYFGPVGSAFIQETDTNHPNIASDGVFALQQNPSFSLPQIAGNYAFETSGSAGAPAEVLTGEFAASTATPGVISSGTVDDNSGGTTNSGVAITSGSYSTSSSPERGTLALTFASPLSQSRNYAVYVVSPAQVFVVGIDSGSLAAGQLVR